MSSRVDGVPSFYLHLDENPSCEELGSIAEKITEALGVKWLVEGYVGVFPVKRDEAKK